MKQGFGYIFTIIIIATLATFFIGLTGRLIYLKKSTSLDYARLQANYLAQSAIVYNDNLKPVLTNHNYTQPQLEELISLTGPVCNFTNGGFKIIKNNNFNYYIGYTGKSVTQAAALKVLYGKPGDIQPWVED